MGTEFLDTYHQVLNSIDNCMLIVNSFNSYKIQRAEKVHRVLSQGVSHAIFLAQGHDLIKEPCGGEFFLAPTSRNLKRCFVVI